jgi:hypothetical protein
MYNIEYIIQECSLALLTSTPKIDAACTPKRIHFLLLHAAITKSRINIIAIITEESAFYSYLSHIKTLIYIYNEKGSDRGTSGGISERYIYRGPHIYYKTDIRKMLGTQCGLILHIHRYLTGL